MKGVGERLDELYARTMQDDASQGIEARLRQYDPRLYGKPVGTLWPVTDADAAAGKHREPSAESQAERLDSLLIESGF